MNTFIPYSRQTIGEEDIQAVIDVLRSDMLTQGPAIKEFESALAAYCAAKFAVVFSSGTAALHAAYFAAGIGAGDEIVTSPVTFAATANAALYLGARPRFVDIEPDTGNLAPDLVEMAMTERTKAIVPIHFAGHPCDIAKIQAIATDRGIPVIEDACHALGAAYLNRPIGCHSAMTVFSFHAVKSITTGEGGAVLTSDPGYYEKLNLFRSHGITKDRSQFDRDPHGAWYYEMKLLGYNYRMTDVQAALGISQLKKLDGFIERRRTTAGAYNAAFRNNPFFDVPVERSYARSSYHLYPLRLREQYTDRKEGVVETLRNRGLGVQVHYIPVYWHPYYQALGYRTGSCPHAEHFYRRELSIPVYPSITDHEVDRVIDILNTVFKALPA